jgi:hypothetical protein
MARRRMEPRLNLLTVRQVLNAGEGDHNDGAGLLLRVTTSGASWVMRHTAPSGRRREMGLGACERHNTAAAGQSIVRARDQAAKARAMLCDTPPRDPLEERDKAKATARKAEARRKAASKQERVTLARAARDYHECVIEPNRTDKHGQQWIRSLEQHVPEELWHRPLTAITAPEVLDFIVGLHQKIPETANRVLQRLVAVFDDGQFRGLVDTNPATPVRRKLREAARTHKRGSFAALPFTEAPSFMGRLRGVPGVVARALEFTVLTASRTGEVGGPVVRVRHGWEGLDASGRAHEGRRVAYRAPFAARPGDPRGDARP